MKIEVWSDYVCPFCYIGKRRLEMALSATGLQDKAEVVYKVFQLDPTTPAMSGGSSIEGLSKKYGISLQEAKQMMANVAEQAKTVGLSYNVEEMKVANTLDAHRLAKLGEAEGKSFAVTERLMSAHFIQGERVDDPIVLTAIADEVGISTERIATMLQSDEFKDSVQQDIAEAGEIGVQGVPFFVINRKYAISGAQPTEVFEQALRKVAEEEGITPQLKVLGDESQGICTDDHCDM